MGRKASGQVVERSNGRGYALRFRAYGERRYVTLEDGVSRQEAERQLGYVLADVERGIWRPPEPEPEVELRDDPTFHQFASEWFEAKRRELRPNTVAAYEWEITHHLLPFFARHRLSEITVAEVDRYRNAKLRERERGRRLSNETINKTITRLGQILDQALEYELIDRNPAMGKRRRLKVPVPVRTWLDSPEQIAALLDAAGKLDAEARRTRYPLGRVLLVTLTFTGLRIGEALDLRWRDVDLAAGRVRVGHSKTDAGAGRYVELLPTLREDLTAYKTRCHSSEADALVFAPKSGKRLNESNVRNRILADAVVLANEQLQEHGFAPIVGRVTPHSLRRTFASLLYALGKDPAYVMDQLGHSDPKLALRIYARAMGRQAGEIERLSELAGVPHAAVIDGSNRVVVKPTNW